MEIELIGVPFDGYGRPGNQASAPGVLREAGLAVSFGSRQVIDSGDLDLPAPCPERGADTSLVNETALLAMAASDPAVLIHDRTAYLYTGHDEAPPDVEDFVMRDWHCFSSTDLHTWHPHGPLLQVNQFAWARDGAKAGTVVERSGRFFWYVAVNHATIAGGAIGVAVAPGPTGAVPRRPRRGARHQRHAVRQR